MSYTIDERKLERQRLLARVLEPLTKRLLDALRLPPDSRCLDIGCGIGETTRLIARYLGPQGECTGIDQDARSLKWRRLLHRLEHDSAFGWVTPRSYRSRTGRSTLCLHAISSSTSKKLRQFYGR